MVSRPKVLFLADDIWETPDDGNRYEVIDGTFTVSAAPSLLHQLVQNALVVILSNFVKANRLGIVVSAPTGLKLSEHDGVEPDIIFVSRERRHILTKRGLDGAPDLVVEVLSPSTASRDRTIKMRLYAVSGVPHYWIVDPFGPTIEAYALGENGYGDPIVRGPGAVFTPTLFPSLSIAVGDLVAEVDMLP